MTAQERCQWVIERYAPRVVLSSSFGAQSAVMLHMATQVWADIPVILIDTGYLFPETYQFVDELTERLHLNLKVYRSNLSPAWQEARYGKQWLKGLKGLETYNQLNKVEPMQKALEDQGAEIWLSGIRRSQSGTRRVKPFIEQQDERFKVYPILDWSDKDVHRYLTKNDLPYHPLWFKGYVSIGDVHTTRRLSEVESVEETRFFGLKRECGLHS